MAKSRNGRIILFSTERKLFCFSHYLHDTHKMTRSIFRNSRRENCHVPPVSKIITDQNDRISAKMQTLIFIGSIRSKTWAQRVPHGHILPWRTLINGSFPLQIIPTKQFTIKSAKKRIEIGAEQGLRDHNSWLFMGDMLSFSWEYFLDDPTTSTLVSEPKGQVFACELVNAFDGTKKN